MASAPLFISFDRGIRYSKSMTTQQPAPTRPPASKGTIAAWAMWDVGDAAFNAIMTTFVFSVYLTSSSFGDSAQASSTLSAGLAIAGLAIALLAPVTGQRSDASGRRTFWLGFNTLAAAVLMGLCWFVAPNPNYLLLGVVLIALANVVNEFAFVNYNALLPEFSTPQNVGRISGLGWASGYFGGIVALALVLLLFVGLGDGGGLLGLPTENSENIRAVAVFSALWCTLFSLPLLFSLRRRDRLYPPATGEKTSFLESYRQLWRTLVSLYRQAPQTLYFLCASAIFRDGLNGVFTFGGILAAGTFGFATTDVIIFAIAGNIVAGVAALIGGKLDDVLGPKAVIVLSLAGILVAAAPLLIVQETWLFWVCGLALCAFVGPAQSASRTYLSRLAPAGQEGEIFGLYSTTGRAASFFAPALFAFFIWLFHEQIWGIAGIMLVILVGLLLVLPLAARPGETQVNEVASR